MLIDLIFRKITSVLAKKAQVFFEFCRYICLILSFSKKKLPVPKEKAQVFVEISKYMCSKLVFSYQRQISLP